MRSMGMAPSIVELQVLINEVDQDGNGEIDFEEFCDVMKRMSSKDVSWNEIIKQCFEVFDQVYACLDDQDAMIKIDWR